jgi:hypothetical protein
MMSPYIAMALASERQHRLMAEAESFRLRKKATAVGRRKGLKAEDRRRKFNWKVWIPRRYVEC